MKLTEIVVDNYRNLRNLRLPNLSDGLNVIYGGNGSGKSNLASYLRDLLCGPSQGVRIDAELFDNFFHIPGRMVGQETRNLSSLLQRRLDVPVGEVAFGNESTYQRRASESDLAQSRLAEVQQRITALEYERSTLSTQTDSTSQLNTQRLAAIDHEINNLKTGSSRLVDELTAAIAKVDTEIAQVRVQIETATETVVAAPAQETHQPILLLYQRLDDLDNQIRRWRSVHSDIQQQRVRLKDEMLVSKEMTIDSEQHPYYRARNLLTSLEQKVGQAEVYAKQYHADIGKPAISAENLATHVEQICTHMRDDIYSLCDELTRQFKTIRHRAAAAELKQLRRCYNEMTENIERLVNRRLSVIEEIRVTDPAGADAIVRAEHQFCQCAQHEGYLQARRRFVGAIPNAKPAYTTIQPDTTRFQQRLNELETVRRDRVSQLVAEENRSHEITSRLNSLQLERQHLTSQTVSQQSTFQQNNFRLAEIERKLAHESAELSRLRLLADSQTVIHQPANELITTASHYANRLTHGEIDRVWLTPTGIEVRNRQHTHVGIESLGAGTRELIDMSLRLAGVGQLNRRGMIAPMLIDDAFVNLDPQHIETTLNVLAEFAAAGHQLVSFTADRNAFARASTLLQGARPTERIAVYEMPQTSVSPGTIVTPERSLPFEPPRQPEFLTPFTIRNAASPMEVSRHYPMVKYPPIDQIDSHEIHHFETTAPLAQSPLAQSPLAQSPLAQSPLAQSIAPPVAQSFARPVNTRNAEYRQPVAPPTNTVFDSVTLSEDTDLRTIDLVDSIHLGQLSESGISSVGQLLELAPTQLPVAVLSAGVNTEQIDRWQSQAWLMICVPGLTPSEARVLVATGIAEPEQLDASNSTQLLQRVERFLSSQQGSRYAARTSGLNLNRVNDWYRALDQTRSRWRQSSGYSRRNRWRSKPEASSNAGRSQFQSRPSHPSQASRPLHRDQRSSDTAYQRDQRDSDTSRLRSRAQREPYNSEANSREPQRRQLERRPKLHTASLSSSSRPKTRKKTRSRTADKALKFYLELDSHIEAAPSIGPKTAERFEKIGVSTVREFLKQTAESISTKLNYKRMTADVIRQWQHHARLVCRIPNLRGHDAQLLVACGIIDPEELAIKQPQSLFRIVGPFSDTKEGLKIIRNGKKPDLAEITDWIDWAGHTRSLQAA